MEKIGSDKVWKLQTVIQERIKRREFNNEKMAD